MSSLKPVKPLTPREKEVAHTMGRGLSYPQAARELGCSARMVRMHVANIVEKLPPAAGEITAQRRVALWAQANFGIREDATSP